MRKCQKRPIIRQKRPINTSIPKVCVCTSVKRGLPHDKRDLLYAQKRPTDILAYLCHARSVAHADKTHVTSSYTYLTSSYTYVTSSPAPCTRRSTALHMSHHHTHISHMSHHHTHMSHHHLRHARGVVLLLLRRCPGMRQISPIRASVFFFQRKGEGEGGGLDGVKYVYVVYILQICTRYNIYIQDIQYKYTIYVYIYCICIHIYVCIHILYILYVNVANLHYIFNR